MKATGIVRRIDELGRVVIPKEIRRTLRIKEGDPLEIFTEREELMLKKYSPIATMEKFSGTAAKAVCDLSGFLTIICDTDEILSACGEGRKNFEGKTLSQTMDKLLKERRSYLAAKSEGAEIYSIAVAEYETTAQMIVPVITGGDCLGAVILLSDKEGAVIDNASVKLAQLTAAMLAGQFE